MKKSKQNKRRMQAENRFQMNKSSSSSSSSTCSSSSSSSMSTELEEKATTPPNSSNCSTTTTATAATVAKSDSIHLSNNNNSSQPAKTKRHSLHMKHIPKWNVTSTVEWLKHIGYEDCGVHFREHRINGRALLMLGEEDLKEIIKHNVGQRKNLYHLIRLLQIKYNRYMNKLNSSFFSNNSADEEEENNVYDTDGNENENEQAESHRLNEKDSIKSESKKVNGFVKCDQSKQISYENDEINENLKHNNSIQNHLISESRRELKEEDDSYSDDSDRLNNLDECNDEHLSNYLKKYIISWELRIKVWECLALNFYINRL